MSALFVGIRIALRAIMRSKLRAALTILGILIGVAAVVIVVSLGNAVQAIVMGQIETMGANSIFIFPQDTRASGARTAERARLTEADADAILRESTSVAAITPYSSTRAQLVAGERNYLTQVVGVEDAFFEIMRYSVDRGQSFTTIDYRTKTKVVLLGETVRRELFGTADGIGEYIRIGKHPFRVIGILKSKGQSPFGEDQDDRVIAPIGTFNTRILRSTRGRVQQLVASATDDRTVDRAVAQIERILRQRHQILDEDEPDFQIRTQAEIRKSNEAIFGALTALLSSIAAISLLVGGIGVMNIMLVSVTERIREIGIRMAIGAREANILMQFLIEAITLSALGGVFGLALGAGAIMVLRQILGWPMTLPLDAVISAIVTSSFIGVVFGFLPARRAARVDPIVALRHE